MVGTSNRRLLAMSYALLNSLTNSVQLYMKNLKVLHAKDGYSIADMLDNLDGLMGNSLTDETIEEIGNADLTCYKCGIKDGTVVEVEAFDQTINYCALHLKEFEETYLVNL